MIVWATLLESSSQKAMFTMSATALHATNITLPTMRTTTEMPKRSYFLQVLQSDSTLCAIMSATALHATSVAPPTTMTTTKRPKRSYSLQVLQSVPTFIATMSTSLLLHFLPHLLHSDSHGCDKAIIFLSSFANVILLSVSLAEMQICISLDQTERRILVLSKGAKCQFTSRPVRLGGSGDLCWAPFFCAGAYAGHHFCVLGARLGLMFVCWGLCWASCLCAGAYAGTYLCVPGPMLGLILVCWGRCWASCLWAGAYAASLFLCWGLCLASCFGCAGADAGPHFLAGLGPMLGITIVRWGL